jgi:hypothetical protein
MVQVLRIPQESSLSPARWEFVNGLWRHYTAAGRPTLEEIAKRIGELNEDKDSAGGTSSTETIRRMLKGTTVPPKWPTARSALRALCSLAGYDAQERGTDHFGDEDPSPEEELRWAWNRALDDPLGGKPKPPADPWGQ